MQTLLFVSMLVPLCGQAQERSHWRYFTSLDGLKESWISSITVGPTGNIWINHGDVDQMSMYDGFAFQRLPSPGPSVKVVENSDGQIWTLDLNGSGGFKQFVNGQWITYPLEEIDSNRQPISIFYRMPFHSLQKDRVLFLRPDGLMEFDAISNRIQSVKDANQTSLGDFIDMKRSCAGGVWITGTNGIALYRNGLWKDYLPPDSFRVERFQRPIETNPGDVFVTTYDETVSRSILLRFDNGVWSMPSVPIDENIHAGWRCHDGGIWILTDESETKRLYHVYDQNVRSIENTKILNGRYSDFAVESNGIFWIGSTDGLARYTPPLWRIPPEIQDIKFFHSIHQDENGRLWLLSPDRLLRLLNGEWKRYSLEGHEFQQSPVIGNMISLSDDRIVLGANGGDILIFDIETETVSTVDKPENHHLALPTPSLQKGFCCIAYNEQERYYSLIDYDGETFQTLIPFLSTEYTENFRSILWRADNEYWLGGNRGLVIYKDNKIISFRQNDPYYIPGAFTILPLNDGRVWVGGRDQIHEFRSGAWNQVDTPPLETVRTMIQASDGSIWVASGTGIHHYFSGSWMTYTYGYGLPDARIKSIYEDRDGRIWASTYEGLALFYRDADREPPQTVIPENKNLATVQSSGEAKFFFIGMDKWKHTLPEELVYSYLIDRSAWSSYQSDTFTSARGLKPGKHSFEVRAMDRNGNVDPSPASFEFTVLLPWYREPIFLVFAVISILLITVSLGYAVHHHLWLHNLVEKRTRDLHDEMRMRKNLQEQFIQAQKMEAIGVLAGGVAHDFNNILMAIGGNCDLILMNEEIDASILHDVKEIKKASERAANLTRQLLAFSRKQILEPTIVNLNHLIQNMTNMLVRLIGENIQLTFIPDTNLESIKIDRGQMEQIVMNLVVNAKDAMDQGGALTIETKNIFLDEDYTTLHDSVVTGPYVMLVIGDTGHGMDKETQKRIFDPFYTTKELGRGTGLGLSTVYGIVKQCKGHIWIYSEVGKGTIFKIYFPSIQQPTTSSVQSVSIPPSMEGKETILIVEDDDMVRKILCRTLKGLGYRILEARNGKHALQMCDRHDGEIDLVLTDVIMPEMSGQELGQQLSLKYPEIKILYMSGYTDNVIAHHGILEEGIEFLHKPATPTELGQKIRSILES